MTDMPPPIHVRGKRSGRRSWRGILKFDDEKRRERGDPPMVRHGDSYHDLSMAGRCPECIAATGVVRTPVEVVV